MPASSPSSLRIFGENYIFLFLSQTGMGPVFVIPNDDDDHHHNDDDDEHDNEDQNRDNMANFQARRSKSYMLSDLNNT